MTTPAVLSAAISAAVASTRTADLDQFSDTSARLANLDIELVGIVQASVIVALLEQSHPDGLDGDDVRALLARTEQSAHWYPDFNAEALLLVLTGALGMAEPDAQPPFGRALLAAHANFVIADLSSAEPELLTGQLAHAVAEISRAETMELP